jgi:hypothetical protein
MSGGPVGEGESYWAAIKITKKLSKKDLQKVVAKLKQLLAANGGAIVSEARASTKATPSFTLRAPDVPQGRDGG